MATGHARPFQPRPNNSDASWLNRPLVERARYLRLFAQELHKVRRGSRTGGVYGPQCSASAFHRRSPAVAADRHHSGVGLCVDRNMPCLQVARDDLHDRPRQTGRLPIADHAMALHAPPQPGNRMAGDGDRRLGRACRGCCPQRFVPRARHPRVICAEARGWYSDFHSFALTPPRGCCRNPLPVLRLW